MDIYHYLKKDHRKVSDLMEQVLQTPDKSEQKDLFAKIKAELTLHAKTEEATFYAALEDKKKIPDDLEHAEEEHHEIEDYLNELSALETDDKQWLDTFKKFKKTVEHHVKEEEEGIFPKAQKILTDKEAEKLADKMDTLKTNAA